MKGYLMRNVAAALLVACLLAGPALAARSSRKLSQLDGLKAFVAGVSEGRADAPAAAAAEPAVTATNGPLATALKQSVSIDVNTDNNGKCVFGIHFGFRHMTVAFDHIQGDDDDDDEDDTTTDTVTNIIDGVNDVIDTIGKAAVTGAKIAKVLQTPLLSKTVKDDSEDEDDSEDDECDCDEHDDHCDCCKGCHLKYVHVIPVPVHPCDHNGCDKEEEEDEKTVKDISFHKLLKAKLGEATDTVLSKWAGAATAAEMLLGLKDTSKVVIEEAEVEKDESDDTTEVTTTTTTTAEDDSDNEKVVKKYPYHPYEEKSKDDGKVVVQVILGDEHKPDDGKYKVVAAAGAPAVAAAVQAALQAP